MDRKRLSRGLVYDHRLTNTATRPRRHAQRHCNHDERHKLEVPWIQNSRFATAHCNTNPPANPTIAANSGEWASIPFGAWPASHRRRTPTWQMVVDAAVLRGNRCENLRSRDYVKRVARQDRSSTADRGFAGLVYRPDGADQMRPTAT
jgi:hypothetical protein